LKTVIFRLPKSEYNPIVFVGIAIHVLLVCLTRKDALILDVLMYWIGIALIFDFKVNQFKEGNKIFHSYILVKIITILTLGLLLFGGVVWGQEEQFLRLCPIIMLIVFAANYANTKNTVKIAYLIAFSIFIIPTRSSLDVLRILIEPTAQFVVYLMSIIGMSLKQDHAILAIGHHLIEISPACASVGTMRRVISAGIWVALFKPRLRFGILWIPFVFFCYAFLVNGLRLAALVALKASDNDPLFLFWHDGGGKTLLPLLTLSPLLLFLRKPSQLKRQNLV
jgi:exosortase/archaeosortase family protein